MSVPLGGLILLLGLCSCCHPRTPTHVDFCALRTTQFHGEYSNGDVELLLYGDGKYQVLHRQHDRYMGLCVKFEEGTWSWSGSDRVFMPRPASHGGDWHWRNGLESKGSEDWVSWWLQHPDKLSQRSAEYRRLFANALWPDSIKLQRVEFDPNLEHLMRKHRKVHVNQL